MYANLVHTHDDAIWIPNASYAFIDSTREPIASRNVCQISHWPNATVYTSQCFVCAVRLVFFFVCLDLFKKSHFHTDSNTTKICGTAKLSCLIDAGIVFYSTKEFFKCKCLPSCSVLTYNAFPSTTDFDFTRTLSQTSHHKDFDLKT